MKCRCTMYTQEELKDPAGVQVPYGDRAVPFVPLHNVYTGGT